MVNQSHPWRLDFLQVAAVGLVVILGFSLTALVSSQNSTAQTKPGPVIQAELAETQPSQIIQDRNQWLARFKFSTESIDPVAVEGLVFYPQGTLQFQINRYLTVYPLTVRINSQLVGKGESWLRQDGYLVQEVRFAHPLKVDLLHPVQVDVYADLLGQYQETFGLGLMSVESSVPIQGPPLQGKLFEIKERF